MTTGVAAAAGSCPSPALGTAPATEAGRTFTLTVFDPPALRPGGSPDEPDGVVWPTRGARWTGDEDALARLLLTPIPGEGKFACPFFLVGAFAGDERRNTAFERASVVALDVEGGPTTREAHERFVGAMHLLYTTWRHTRDAHRFRLVFPLARDVTATEYRLLWALLAKRLRAGADPQTKDLARALFLPAIRPDGGRAAAKAWTGAPLLDPDAELVEALALVRPTVAPPVRPYVRPALTLAEEEARRLARRRLATDPEARERAAAFLGARVRARRAEGMACPGCGRASAWFWVVPGRMGSARCNHRNTCGWYGPLDELLDAHGSAVG